MGCSKPAVGIAPIAHAAPVGTAAPLAVLCMVHAGTSLSSQSSCGCCIAPPAKRLPRSAPPIAAVSGALWARATLSMQTPAPAPSWPALPAVRIVLRSQIRLTTLPWQSGVREPDSGLSVSITIMMTHVLLDSLPLMLELVTVLSEGMRSAVDRDPALSGFFCVLLLVVHSMLARAGAPTATAAALLSSPVHPLPPGHRAAPGVTVSMVGTARVFDGRLPLATQGSEATGFSSLTWWCAAHAQLLGAPSSSRVRSSLRIWPNVLGPLPCAVSARSGRPRLPALSSIGFCLCAALARAWSRMRRRTREEEGLYEEGEELRWEGVGISVSLLASRLMETPIPPGPSLTSASTTVQV